MASNDPEKGVTEDGPELQPAADDNDLIEVRKDPDAASLDFFNKAMGMVAIPLALALQLSISARFFKGVEKFMLSFTTFVVAGAITVVCFMAFLRSKKVRSEKPLNQVLAVFLMLAQGIFYGCLATYINYL